MDEAPACQQRQLGMLSKGVLSVRDSNSQNFSSQYRKQIEAPYMPDPIPPMPVLRAEPPHILPDYNSIGEFYRQMERGEIVHC